MPDPTRRRALRFVVLVAIVSLFADMTYEGMRSSIGPYLGTLGASAAVVGFVAGFGELAGYALRLVSGWAADRTKRYWPIAIVGYAVNMLAVPALAFAGSWPTAAALVVLERVGKATRVPSRDAMLSHASGELGLGWVFGLHEALDQTGALVGPLAVAVVLFLHGGDYRLAFALLGVPALLALATLALARFEYPRPQDLEVRGPKLGDLAVAERAGFPRRFWLYAGASALVAAGFADFPLLAYHFHAARVLPDAWVPVAYAVAMGVGSPAALVAGRLLDRAGYGVLVAVALVGALAAPLAFLGGSALAVAGVVVWGIALGAHESVMKAVVAGMVPADRRASAFGVYNLAFGVAWFVGSAALGVLYAVSVPALVAFSVVATLAAIPPLLALARDERRLRALAGP